MSPKYRIIPFLLLLLLSLETSAQESTSIFNFLNLPTSAHATALGGKNISLIEDDASLIFQNPALMGSVSDKTLNLNFMTYMQGSKTGSVSYVQAQGERGTWGVSTQFVGYGDIPNVNTEGIILGKKGALDMAIAGGYSYMLSDYWVGGVTGKFLYSNYAGYSSIGLAVDLGVSYFNPDNDFSFAFVAANLGGQVKAFGEVHEKLPVDLQFGISKGLGSWPVRVHVMLYDMLHWDKAYYLTDCSGFRVFLNHLDIGLDATLFNGRFWVGMGYNFRRATCMVAEGASNASGITFGAGINIKRFKLGLAYGNYHTGAPTIAITTAYSFPSKKKQASTTKLEPDNKTL
ncbi:MAG: type IX secretion system protein PorQ [Bacteroidaceae bacterium]|nr:type IX secretion system protein PorQ [Bacteroidaceae bacterium]